MKCIACPLESIRIMSRPDGVAFGLCAHHVRRAILYLRPEQVAKLVGLDEVCKERPA